LANAVTVITAWDDPNAGCIIYIASRKSLSTKNTHSHACHVSFDFHSEASYPSGDQLGVMVSFPWQWAKMDAHMITTFQCLHHQQTLSSRAIVHLKYKKRKLQYFRNYYCMEWELGIVRTHFRSQIQPVLELELEMQVKVLVQWLDQWQFHFWTQKYSSHT
jgi:hypothetical protein